MVPHGTFIIDNASANFRFTGKACPARHFTAAEAMCADVTDADRNFAGDLLPDRIIAMMKDTRLQNGLTDIGYGKQGILNLVKDTLPQQRLSIMPPQLISEPELTWLFKGSSHYW